MNTQVTLTPGIVKYLDSLNRGQQDRILTEDMVPGQDRKGASHWGHGRCLVGVAEDSIRDRVHRHWEVTKEFDNLCYGNRGPSLVQQEIRAYLLRPDFRVPYGVTPAPAKPVIIRDPFTNHPVAGPRYRRRRALVSTLVMLLCCLVIA